MNFKKMTRILVGASTALASLVGLNGCTTSMQTNAPEQTPNGVQPSTSFASSTVCTENAFLQKYQCSFNNIEQAARAGDPDAQYALGYLYYYGIGTTQDKQAGLVWIKKAAAQGQTVAQDALKALSTTQTSASIHPKKNTYVQSTNQSGQTASVNAPSAAGTSAPASGNSNAQTPSQPISDMLPNYNQQRVNVTTTPPQVDLSTAPPAQN